MTYDPEKAYDTDENGLAFRDSDGTMLCHVGVGFGVPSVDSPVGSRYFQIDNPTASWIKTAAGSGNGNWTDTNTQNSVIGNIYSVVLGEQGAVDDEWLENPADNRNTHTTPVVIPWDSKLVAATFSNSDDNSDIDLELYRVPFGQGRGPNPAEKIATIQLRDTRVFVKNNYGASNIDVNVGDKLAVYGRNVNITPDNVNLTLYFQVTGSTVLDDSEQYSGSIREED